MKVKKEQKDKRRIKRKSEGLKIYSPDGRKLLYTGEPGFSLDYQELIRQTRQKYRQKSQESKYRRLKRGF